MRTAHLSTALLAFMFAGGLAYADETAGTVKSVDPAAGTVTLENGTVYSFDETNETKDRYNMLSGYKPGDAVTIVWEEKEGDEHRATEISPVDE